MTGFWARLRPRARDHVIGFWAHTDVGRSWRGRTRQPSSAAMFWNLSPCQFWRELRYFTFAFREPASWRSRRSVCAHRAWPGPRLRRDGHQHKWRPRRKVGVRFCSPGDLADRATLSSDTREPRLSLAQPRQVKPALPVGGECSLHPCPRPTVRPIHFAASARRAADDGCHPRVSQ